ncbi:MAG TPA: TonB-dependent receptor [Acidobacteriaceae bacterium]|nr:TonB-dependent receptor [Acidobacteriaceae bacterium]
MRKIVLVFTLICFGLLAPAVCRAQNRTAINGKVVDSSGAAIPNAAVSLTNLATNTETHTTTGPEGRFVFSDLPPGPELITVEKSGFDSFTQRVTLSGQQATTTVTATMQVAALAESIVVRGTVNPEAKPVPSREDVMVSPETLRVLDRKQIEAAGPVAGGAQMLEFTPGANVVGYGETGATKYTILLNGAQQGWAGEATSFTGPGSLGITYDGVPVVDPATGLWQSATMPQNLIIQNMAVTYGPGQPDNRWYSDVGGRVEYTPVQPTVDRHLSLEGTEGPYGQQNFALVGNTGALQGWSTVVGGGVGRGDDYRAGPDGFANPAKNGSAFGKTLKTFSDGSLAFAAFYAKGGGYRAQVIPTTDIGLIEPNIDGTANPNGIHYSEPTSGFYSSLPFNAYNKYDTNEMFMTYARQHLFMGPRTTLQNTTWYNHIRRFHRRNDDALSQGAQVDEWNNPHSNIFGDQAGMTEVLPYNTVDFGGYLLHEVYNAHNLFYNPADGGSGALQIVGQGSKFRSGYFQQDNVTFYAQDDFHPIPQIHIIPGVRVDGFSTSYSDQAARDFTFASSTYFAQHADGTVSPSNSPVYETHCALFPQTGSNATDPYYNVWGNPVATPDGSVAKDQGSLCGAHESRSAVEPSIDASVMPRQWLTLYGGYDTLYRSPALGGGGGMFQAVDPQYYMLAKSAYSQGGVKVHFTNAPGLGNFIVGVDYFHYNYTNQEIDVETAAGVELTSGGNSTYHGVDLFFDADPKSNIHFMLNFAGEASSFTNYVTGGTEASCAANPAGCVSYNNLPVSYVPDVTLNAGIYYGIRHHNRELIEPRFYFQTVGSQHLWSNNTGAPVTQTMPSYTTANLSFIAPVTLEKQSFSLRLDMMNIANTKYNEWEYISSGGYFAALFPAGQTVPSGYINAYPGAPLAIYGTISYQF